MPDLSASQWLERCEEAARRVYTDEGVWIVLHGRNRHFDEQRPIDLIYAGRGEDVYRYLAGLYEGMVAS